MQLRQLLDYNEAEERDYDNGVFWIDFDSHIHFYGTAPASAHARDVVAAMVAPSC